MVEYIQHRKCSLPCGTSHGWLEIHCPHPHAIALTVTTIIFSPLSINNSAYMYLWPTRTIYCLVLVLWQWWSVAGSCTVLIICYRFDSTYHPKLVVYSREVSTGTCPCSLQK